MQKKEGLGSAKRFGTRYGATLKLKLAKIEKEQRKKHECPYCGKPKVSRVSYGIWHCGKCSATFTGAAYTIARKVVEEVA